MRPPGSLVTADPRGGLLYFYLSYARLGPLPTESQLQVPAQAAGRGTGQASEHGSGAEMDPEVQKFFEELDAEIMRRTRRRGPAGFCDRGIPLGTDPRKVLSDALSQAQVFVALYSPSYLRLSWPRREQNAFRIRMTQQQQDPEARMLPLLWTLVPPWTIEADDLQPLERARDLVPDTPEYTENGLRALSLRSGHANAYHRVLDHVADRVIRIVETSPVPPGAALDLDQIPDAPKADPSFVITVLTEGPESAAKSWRPYPGRQGLSIADYAARAAERFSLAPLVVEFSRFPGHSRNNPAVAVVDPRILQQPDGENNLRQSFQNLPIWVYPLVVGDNNDTMIDELTTRAQQVLSESLPTSSGLRARAVERVDRPQEAEAKLINALAKARQAYLRYGTYRFSPLSQWRPRLTGSDDGPPSGQESDGDQ